MMRFVRTTLLTLTLALAATLTLPSAASAQQCASSGPYTDTLCDGQYLLAGAYLYSPGDQYRFYYQSDGGGVIYQWNGSSFAAYRTVINPNSNPGYTMFLAAYPGSPGPGLYAWSGSSTLYFGSASGWPGGLQGESFIRLETDGCLRVYDQGGARWNLTLGGVGCW